jgi:hypothetical protein
MKKITFFSILLILTCTAHICKAQTIDEIINRYVDSIGGAARLQSLKTLKLYGTLNRMGTDIDLVVSKTHQVGTRVDISVNGQDGYKIYTATKGWNFMPFMGQTAPEAMAEDEVKIGVTGLDLQGNLFNYKEKGTTLTLNGKETVDGLECYKINATLKSGKSLTYFIDTKSYHLVKVTAKINIGGEDKESSTSYSNYKATTDGYIFSFSSVTENGEINYSKIEVNKPIDDKIYSPN